jgi:hypothetical protein
MAYVVRRRNGRFEVRESLHTPNGPRARSLASFEVLTDEALARAAGRALRPFDARAVVRSARRAGAGVRLAVDPAAPGRSAGAHDRFLAGSMRMANALRHSRPARAYVDPGVALADLLGFADMVAAGRPPRRFEPLAFPPLNRLAERRRGTSSGSGGGGGRGEGRVVTGRGESRR